MGRIMLMEFDWSFQNALPIVDKSSWQYAIASFINEWNDESRNSFSINTSGSTGTPKEIIFSRADLLRSANRTNDFFKLDNNSVFLNCLPLNHIAGIMMVVRSFAAKGKLICVKPATNPLIEFVQTKRRISFAAFTPMQIFEIISNPETAELFSEIQHVIIGGAKVSEELINKLKGYSNDIYETYGMTETVSHIALRQIAPKFLSHFEVMHGVAIKSGSQGNLMIRIDTSDWIETKDVVTMKDEIRFSWKGRLDDVINTGGEKVFVSEIEAILSKAIVFNFYITKMEDEVLGEKVAFVSDYDVDISFLKKIILDYLSPYQRPRVFIQLAEIKQSSLGKTQRYFSTEEIIKKVNLSYS
jgi:o-succinylbenzoate---CoA ligase